MAGIKKLNSIYETNGLLEAKKYLDGNITITEKLDAHRFSFQVNENGSLSFYKKNDNREISKIDRIISDLYESAISHITTLPNNIISSIPKNMRFGFAYFHNNKPLRLKYEKIKTKLVLTDISTRNNVGKVKKVYEDKEYLDSWATILSTGFSPIIYQGKLDENQKTYILNMLRGSGVVNAFFAQHIEGIFGNTFSGNNIIESIVIKNKHGLVQFKDPSYKIFNEAAKPLISRDFYDLTIIQIQEFMNKYELPIYTDNTSEEDRYIDLVSNAYNKFIDENLIDENLNPDYLRPNIVGSHGNLGRKFISNPGTLGRINTSNLNEELYKVFLLSLNRKRGVHGLLNNSIVNNLNRTIDNIQECINRDSSLLTYTEINKVFEANKLQLEKQPDYIKLLSSLQMSFSKKIIHEKTKALPNAICIVTKFDFYTKEIEQIIEDNKEGSIILVNLAKNNVGLSTEIFQLKDTEITQILKSVSNQYPQVKEIVNCEYYSLEEIFTNIRYSGFEPIKFYTDEDCVVDFSLQYVTSKNVLGDRIKISNDFDIEKLMDKYSRDIFRSVEDDDYKRYKESSPELMKNFWDIYKSRYSVWKMTDSKKLKE